MQNQKLAAAYFSNEKWDEMNRALGHLCAKLGKEILLRMVRWLRWHWPPDTRFEIRALAVWGRARYLSVTEAPHNTDFHTWMGKKHFCFFQTAETGNRTPNSGVKGNGANHYPRAPALSNEKLLPFCLCSIVCTKWPKSHFWTIL